MAHHVDTINDARPWATRLATTWRRRTDSPSPAEAYLGLGTDSTSTRSGRRVPFRARRGSRFDGTVALPIDAAARLDQEISATARRLHALPLAESVGHRSVALRVRFERQLREAVQARTRLDAGTYGTCVECSGPISLTLLLEHPSVPRCIYCALDI